MLAKSEKLTLALVLFALAVLFWGIRAVKEVEAYRIAKIFTVGLKKTIEFGDANYPDAPVFTVGFSVLGNEDTITVDRQNMRVYSAKNFIYRYSGYTVICSVEPAGENAFSIECKVD
ncbi:MAG: hypothetical protein GXO08_00720 [Aquificae bacterium]|nr:hypothetical protein [Aquificota bacterium]